MNKACIECKGSCCKSIVFDFGEINEDTKRWILFHSVRWSDRFEFACPCRMLVKGKCLTYEHRPMICKVFEVGSLDCIKAVEKYAKEPLRVKSLFKDN